MKSLFILIIINIFLLVVYIIINLHFGLFYIEFRFNEESTKNIVEGYYKKYEDFECGLEIRRSV